jgi:ribosomal-protein-alanine N-acetyltransferase
MNTIYFKPITNEVVTIREINENDTIDLFELFSNPEVVKYLGITQMKNQDVVLEFIHKIIKDYQNKLLYYLAIELNSNHKLVGYIGLSRFDLTDKTCQVVYALNEDFWHQGITVQALKLFVQYLKNEENKELIICTHIDENINSGKIMVKAGFIRNQDYDQMMMIKGINRRLIGYSIKKRKEYKE